MSPEQLRGKEADARSDIFSLGVTLYECATGTYAFERGTPLEVSLRVVTETPPPPSELNPAVPPGLDRIIARAMAKDPAGRYESAQVASIRSARTPAGARRTGSGVAPGVHGCRRRRTPSRQRSFRFTALIAAAVVATLLAAWFAPASVSPRPPRAAARGRRLVQPRDQRHPRGRVLSGEQGVGARARDRQRVRAGAGSAVRSVRGDRAHRQSQGGTAAGHGAAPGSLDVVRRRVHVSGRRRGNTEPQLQDGDRQVFDDCRFRSGRRKVCGLCRSRSRVREG